MGLMRRVATVSGWTFLSRILGLLRDRFLGAAFGASTTLDAFMIAFALPNLLRNLFGEGALASAFVPRYVRARSEDGAAAEAFLAVVLGRLAIILSLIAALGMVIAGIVALYGAERAALVAWLALPQLPYLILICLAAVMAGALHGRGHFWIPAASPLILNGTLIAAVWWFPQVEALPWAVLIAGIGQIALHIIGLISTVGGVPRPLLRSSERLRDLRRAWLPTVAAASVQQVNAFADSMIAFVLLSHRPGAVTVLYFANRLLQFPMALVAHGVGTAIYPELSSAARQGWPQAGAVLRSGTRILAVLLLPAGVGLFVVADPLVRSIFQTGAFSADDAQRTVLLTQIYAVALLPLSFHKLLVRALHAGLDQRSPLRIAVIAVVVNLVLNIILVQTALAEAGLALATLLSGALACGLAARALAQHGTGAVVSLHGWLLPLLAVVFMGAAVALFLAWWPLAATADTTAQGLRLLLAVALGGAVYALIMGRQLRAALRGQE